MLFHVPYAPFFTFQFHICFVKDSMYKCCGFFCFSYTHVKIFFFKKRIASLFCRFLKWAKGSSLVHSRLLRNCSSASLLWREWGGWRLQLTVWLSERTGTCGNSSKRDLQRRDFFSFLAFFAKVCAYVFLSVCVCIKCSVSVCIIAYTSLFALCWIAVGVWVYLVMYFIGVYKFRPCAPLAVADTLHYQLIRWGVCCPCGNWSGDSHFQSGGLLYGPERKKRLL